MKNKSVLSVLALSCVLCLCSCNTQTKTQNSLTESTFTPFTTFNLSSAPYATVKSSSYSSVESSEALSNWVLNYYVDEFKESTGKAFIASVGTGTFSNSATNNSDLIYSVIIDKDSSGIFKNFTIILYEYGSSQVKNTYSNRREYEIKVKSDSGTISYTGHMASEIGDRITIDYPYSIITSLTNGSDLTFLITQTDRPSTQYLFKVKAEGFNEAYNKL